VRSSIGGCSLFEEQDSEDPNPLIRALAIRTMGCIRVDKIVDYMEEPLRKTLKVRVPKISSWVVI
jgi:AP-1 complex subunit beta-1